MSVRLFIVACDETGTLTGAMAGVFDARVKSNRKSHWH
jgi:hypothetical protein